jgi:hypothetical protein
VEPEQYKLLLNGVCLLYARLPPPVQILLQALDTDDTNSLSCEELCVGIRKLVRERVSSVMLGVGIVTPFFNHVHYLLCIVEGSVFITMPLFNAPVVLKQRKVLAILSRDELGRRSTKSGNVTNQLSSTKFACWMRV